MISSILKDLRDVAASGAAYLKDIEVSSFGLFSVAFVRGLDGKEIVLVGLLGDWWVCQEDTTVRRYAPSLLMNDFIDSCTEILDSIRQSHLFDWFREKL